MRKTVDGPAYIMQSVDQALRLIELFSSRKRLRIMDVVHDLHVAPATASRLVAMLEMYGYVQKDPRATGYVLGERLRRNGELALTDFDLYSPVQPCLEVLAAETGETAQFGVLHGSTVVLRRLRAGTTSITHRVARRRAAARTRIIVGQGSAFGITGRTTHGIISGRAAESRDGPYHRQPQAAFCRTRPRSPRWFRHVDKRKRRRYLCRRDGRYRRGGTCTRSAKRRRARLTQQRAPTHSVRPHVAQQRKRTRAAFYLEREDTFR